MYLQFRHIFLIVAPLVGAWIEITSGNLNVSGIAVAPLVGAWIEISIGNGTVTGAIVAPLVGAWIEMITHTHGFASQPCRSPRGSVD